MQGLALWIVLKWGGGLDIRLLPSGSHSSVVESLNNPFKGVKGLSHRPLIMCS